MKEKIVNNQIPNLIKKEAKIYKYSVLVCLCSLAATIFSIYMWVGFFGSLSFFSLMIVFFAYLNLNLSFVRLKDLRILNQTKMTYNNQSAPPQQGQYL